MPQLARIVVMAVGFALTWFMFQPNSLFGFFLPFDGDLTFYDAWYPAFLGLLVAFSVGVMAARRMLEPLLSVRRLPTFALSELSLVGLALLSWAGGSAHPHAMACVAGVLLSASYVVLVFAWIVEISRLEEIEACLVVTCAAAVLGVLELANSALGATGLPVGTGGSIGLFDFATCLSGVCWLVATCLRPGGDVCCATRAPAPDSRLSDLRALPLPTLGLLVMFALCGRVVIGLYFAYVDALPLSEMAFRCGLIVLGSVYLALALSRSPDRARSARNAWMPVAVPFFLGQLIIVAFDPAYRDFGTGAVTASITCFEALAFVILFLFCRAHRASPVLVVGLGFVLVRLIPVVIQRVAAPRLARVLSLDEQAIVYVAVLAVMLVLSCMLAFFNRLSGASSDAAGASGAGMRAGGGAPGAAAESGPGMGVRAGAAPGAAPGSSQPAARRPSPGQDGDARGTLAAPAALWEACEDLGDEAGLTAREVEVVASLARGNSQKKTSEELGLSLGTVQWYAKSVYKKLDVHSRQELIDLVAARGAARGGDSA